MAKSTKSNSGQVPLTCDMCELPSDVPWYCTNCEASLCNQCKADHLAGEPCVIFKKHNITSRVDALKKKSQEEHCPKHHPNLFVLHCKNCKELVCTTCIHQEHVGHTMEDIADAMKIVEQEITQFSETLKSVTLAKCSTQDLKATEDIEYYRQWYVSMESEVNKRREEVKTDVDHCCDKILLEAAEVKAKHESAAEEHKKQVATCNTEIMSMYSKCKEALGKPISQKLQFSKEISASAEFEVPTIMRVELPSFLPGETVNQQISNQIGQFQTSQFEEAIPMSKNESVDFLGQSLETGQQDKHVKFREPNNKLGIFASAESEVPTFMKEELSMFSTNEYANQQIHVSNQIGQSKTSPWTQAMPMSKSESVDFLGQNLESGRQDMYVNYYSGPNTCSSKQNKGHVFTNQKSPICSEGPDDTNPYCSKQKMSHGFMNQKSSIFTQQRSIAYMPGEDSSCSNYFLPQQPNKQDKRRRDKKTKKNIF